MTYTATAEFVGNVYWNKVKYNPIAKVAGAWWKQFNEIKEKHKFTIAINR